MFRHVALFRFVPDATPEQRLAVVDQLRTLPGQIPELVDYRVGPDAGISPDTYDVAVVADFAEAAHYELYVRHPAHEAIAAAYLRPILAERAAVQYDC